MSRQKSSNLPYRDMAGGRAWSSGSDGLEVGGYDGETAGVRERRESDCVDGEMVATAIGNRREREQVSAQGERRRGSVVGVAGGSLTISRNKAVQAWW